MDEIPKPSLADDPSFLDSLADLDHGLAEGRRTNRPAPAPESPGTSSRPELPHWLPPSAVASVSAASEAFSDAIDAVPGSIATIDAVPGSIAPLAAKPAAPAVSVPEIEEIAELFQAAPIEPKTPESAATPVERAPAPVRIEPARPPARALRNEQIVLAIVIAAFMLVGAIAAAAIFHEPLMRLVERWR